MITLVGMTDRNRSCDGGGQKECERRMGKPLLGGKGKKEMETDGEKKLTWCGARERFQTLQENLRTKNKKKQKKNVAHNWVTSAISRSTSTSSGHSPGSSISPGLKQDNKRFITNMLPVHSPTCYHQCMKNPPCLREQQQWLQLDPSAVVDSSDRLWKRFHEVNALDLSTTSLDLKQATVSDRLEDPLEPLTQRIYFYEINLRGEKIEQMLLHTAKCVGGTPSTSANPVSWGKPRTITGSPQALGILITVMYICLYKKLDQTMKLDSYWRWRLADRCCIIDPPLQ